MQTSRQDNIASRHFAYLLTYPFFTITIEIIRVLTVAITYNTPNCFTDLTAHITAYMLI